MTSSMILKHGVLVQSKICQSFNVSLLDSYFLHCRCMFGSNRFRQKKEEVNYRFEEKKILDSVLGSEVYDRRIRPSGLNSTGNIALISFGSPTGCLNMFWQSYLKICHGSEKSNRLTKNLI